MDTLPKRKTDIAHLLAECASYIEDAGGRWEFVKFIRAARRELLEENRALEEAASEAKYLLDYATYHDGRYEQCAISEFQTRACIVSDKIAQLLATAPEVK